MAKTSAKQSVAKEEPKKAKSSRAISGKVISNKMDKTIVVQVLRMVKHPVYGKYMRHYSKMYVHDAENQSREGDVVKIKQSRPLSKLKSWTLVEIIRRAELGSVNELDETSN
jgi:small subunit ribosomal protein S17